MNSNAEPSFVPSFPSLRGRRSIDRSSRSIDGPSRRRSEIDRRPDVVSRDVVVVVVIHPSRTDVHTIHTYMGIVNLHYVRRVMTRRRGASDPPAPARAAAARESRARDEDDERGGGTERVRRGDVRERALVPRVARGWTRAELQGAKSERRAMRDMMMMIGDARVRCVRDR